MFLFGFAKETKFILDELYKDPIDRNKQEARRTTGCILDKSFMYRKFQNGVDIYGESGKNTLPVTCLQHRSERFIYMTTCGIYLAMKNKHARMEKKPLTLS